MLRENSLGLCIKQPKGSIDTKIRHNTLWGWILTNFWHACQWCFRGCICIKIHTIRKQHKIILHF